MEITQKMEKTESEKRGELIYLPDSIEGLLSLACKLSITYRILEFPLKQKSIIDRVFLLFGSVL